MRFLPLVILAGALTATACQHGTDTLPLGGSDVKVTVTSTFVDSSAAQVGSVVPISVKVTSDGAIAPNAPIAWVIAKGGGRVASASAFTDTLGVGTALWVLGDTTGLNTLTIGSAGDSVQIHAVAFPGPGSLIVRTVLDSIAATPGAAVTISGRVVDFRGNPVSTEAVTWSTDAGTLSVPSSTSDSTGAVKTVLQTGGSPGTYTVTAILPNRASVVFKVATF